jgi:gamma-glutamylcyclotransferase (GGCT)/AIG2-like uncharacterized protein YtfP
MRYPFFVYGTLKRGGANYARYLAGRSSAELPASLPAAALYDFGPYPFLVLEADLARPADVVHGQLISLPDQLYNATLADIDRLEGYLAGDLGPQLAALYVAGPQMLAQIRAGKLPKVAGGMWEGGKKVKGKR